MVKLQWLQVNKFRSVKPGTRLTFNPGYNVMLGQNGTGKTTLLNLISALVRSDFTELRDTEFDLAYELASENGTALIRVHNERRTDPVHEALGKLSSEVLRRGGFTSEGGFQSPAFSAELKFTTPEADPLCTLKIQGARGQIQPQHPRLTSSPYDFDLTMGEPPVFWMLVLAALASWVRESKTPQGLIHPLSDLFTQINSQRFDESLEYFHQLGGLTVQIFRAEGKVLGPIGFIGPTEFLDSLDEMARLEWAADRYILTDDKVPFLRHLAQLLDFESAEAIVELQQGSRSKDSETMTLGNLKFLFTHRGGWKVSEKHLSHGQKRMLAFMHYLGAISSIAIADELVNGLHHRWIRACFEALGERQAFLTSQNPLLLDYLSFQSSEEVRSTFVLCRWEKGPEQMAWENMSQEAAQDFFDSYKVGFQQVGELLQSKGLW